jgi:hypothetical protein
LSVNSSASHVTAATSSTHTPTKVVQRNRTRCQSSELYAAATGEIVLDRARLRAQARIGLPVIAGGQPHVDQRLRHQPQLQKQQPVKMRLTQLRQLMRLPERRLKLLSKLVL